MDFDESAIERDEGGRFAETGGASISGNKKDPKAAKAEVKRGSLAAAAEKLGGDKAIAKKLIDEWQADSSRGQAITLKAAIARELGVDPNKDLERTTAFLASQGEKNAAEHIAKHVAASEDKKVRATVRAMAQASQSAHEGGNREVVPRGERQTGGRDPHIHGGESRRTDSTQHGRGSLIHRARGHGEGIRTRRFHRRGRGAEIISGLVASRIEGAEGLW
jgi:hypothetical protein